MSKLCFLILCTVCIFAVSTSKKCYHQQCKIKRFSYVDCDQEYYKCTEYDSWNREDGSCRYTGYAAYDSYVYCDDDVECSSDILTGKAECDIDSDDN